MERDCISKKRVSVQGNPFYGYCKWHMILRFLVTLRLLRLYHVSRDISSRYKVWDACNYIRGCVCCEQYKDSNQKKLEEPVLSRVPERRLKSAAIDFIVEFSVIKNVCDAISSWVDWSTRWVYFISLHTADAAVDTENKFLKNIFCLHGLPDNIVTYRDPKISQKFRKQVMTFCEVQLGTSSSRQPRDWWSFRSNEKDDRKSFTLLLFLSTEWQRWAPACSWVCTPFCQLQTFRLETVWIRSEMESGVNFGFVLQCRHPCLMFWWFPAVSQWFCWGRRTLVLSIKSWTKCI